MDEGTDAGEHGVAADCGPMQLTEAFNRGNIGRTAWGRAVSVADKLETTHPEQLVGDKPSAEARRAMRMLATLVNTNVPDELLPDAVRTATGNPELDLDMARDVVLGTRAGETSGVVLRRIACLLRQGYPRRGVAASLRVGRGVVDDVARFLAISEAEETRLRSAAIAAKVDGETIRGFAEQHGVGERLAQRHMSEAQQLLDRVRDQLHHLGDLDEPDLAVA